MINLQVYALGGLSNNYPSAYVFLEEQMKKWFKLETAAESKGIHDLSN